MTPDSKGEQRSGLGKTLNGVIIRNDLEAVCWVVEPGIQRQAQKPATASSTRSASNGGKLPATPQWGPLPYNQQKRDHCTWPCSGWALRFPNTRKIHTGSDNTEWGLKKFMDYLDSVLPLWLRYGDLTAKGFSGNTSRRMPAPAVHRTEPGVQTQPRRHYPSP